MNIQIALPFQLPACIVPVQGALNLLSQRIQQQNWNQAIEGDCFQLNGSHSVFGPESICDTIRQRIKDNDIHPVGTLSGLGEPRLQCDALAVQQQIESEFPELLAGLKKNGLEQALRSLRVVPGDVEIQWDQQSCEISFLLTSGSYATAVMHELALINGEVW